MCQNWEAPHWGWLTSVFTGTLTIRGFPMVIVEATSVWLMLRVDSDMTMPEEKRMKHIKTSQTSINSETRKLLKKKSFNTII
jgi:hypothetical protein